MDSSCRKNTPRRYSVYLYRCLQAAARDLVIGIDARCIFIVLYLYFDINERII